MAVASGLRVKQFFGGTYKKKNGAARPRILFLCFARQFPFPLQVNATPSQKSTLKDTGRSPVVYGIESESVQNWKRARSSFEISSIT